MNKFYLTIVLLICSISVFAQPSLGQPFSTNVTVQPKTIGQDRAVGYYVLDYEAYDATFGTTENGAYLFNRRHPIHFTTAGTLGMADAYMVFDTMIVTQDLSLFTAFNGNDVQNFMIDTAFMHLYHENNSTLADTLVLTIKNVSATGTPGSTILWSDTIFTSTSLTTPNTGGSYGFAIFGFPVGLNVPGGNFSLQVSYYGALVDTFGLIGSDITTGANCAVVAAGKERIPSMVYPSSFYKYWNVSAISGVVPNGLGVGGLYIDCDGDAGGGLPADWPAEQAIQTYSIWVSGTLTDNTGVDEQAAGVKVKAFPNPAKDFTTVEFTLQKDANVSVLITDLSGKTVYSNELGKRNAGTSNVLVNTSELNNGIYFYTVVVDNNRVTRRIIVSK